MKEIICGLRLGDANQNNSHALSLQQHLARDLVDAYARPDSHRPFDKWRLDRWRKQAKYQLDQLVPPTVFRTRTFYFASSWARPIHRFFLWLGIDFTTLLSHSVPVMGLNLYAVLGIFEIGLIGKHIFNHLFHSKENLRNRLTWTKFKNLLLQDDRPSRLTKITMWIATSFILLAATGGFALFLELGILVIDTSINLLLRNRKINQSKDTLKAVLNKKEKEYAAIVPFLKNDIVFQRNRHRLFFGITLIMIGSTVAFLPLALIPAVVGFSMMGIGGLTALKQSINLGFNGIFKILDNSLKADYGVASGRRNVAENDFVPEDQKKLRAAKAETLEIIEDYKKKCGRFNWYGKNRANELKKRIEFANNMAFLSDEVAYFLKNGKSESDRANYNILRSVSRRSGLDSNGLRGKLFDKLVPSYSHFRRYDDEQSDAKMKEFRAFDLDQIKQNLVFGAPRLEPLPTDKAAIKLLAAKNGTRKIIEGYKKQCGLLHFSGYQRAEELQETVASAKTIEVLRDEVAAFIKTGKTARDNSGYTGYLSISRSSGCNRDALRGRLYDKLVPSYSIYNRSSDNIRMAKMHEFLKLGRDQMKQQVVFDRELVENNVRRPH